MAALFLVATDLVEQSRTDSFGPREPAVQEPCNPVCTCLAVAVGRGEDAGIKQVVAELVAMYANRGCSPRAPVEFATGWRPPTTTKLGREDDLTGRNVVQKVIRGCPDFATIEQDCAGDILASRSFIGRQNGSWCTAVGYRCERRDVAPDRVHQFGRDVGAVVDDVPLLAGLEDE